MTKFYPNSPTWIGLVVLLFVVPRVCAQNVYLSTEDFEVVKSACFTEANELSRTDHFQKAISLFQGCLSRARNLKDSLIIESEILIQFLLLNEPEKAIEYAMSNPAHHDTLGLEPKTSRAMANFYYSLFIAYRMKGDYMQALAELENGLQYSTNPTARAFLIKEVAITQWRMRDLSKARSSIMLSQSIIRDHPEIEVLSALSAQNNQMLGLLYREDLDLDKALHHFNLAFQYYFECEIDNKRSLFMNNHNMALCLMDQFEYTGAINQLESAQNYLDEIKDDDLSQFQRNYYTHSLMEVKGVAHFFIKDYQKANEYVEQSIELCRRNSGANHPNLIDILIADARIKIKLTEYEKAIASCKKGLEIAHGTYSNFNFKFFQLYNTLAIGYMSTDDITNARLYVDSAYYSNVLTKQQRKHSFDEMYESILTKLNIVRIDPPESIVQDLNELYEVFADNISSLLFNLEAKFASETIGAVIHEFVDLYYGVYVETGNEVFLERLIELSEIKKSRELLKTIVTKKGVFNNLPEEIRDKERNLRKSISETLNSETIVSNKDSLLAILKTEHFQLLDSISTTSTQYNKMVLNRVQFDLQSCQSQIASDELYLFYIETDSNLYAVGLDQSKTYLVKEEKKESLNTFEAIDVVTEAVLSPWEDVMEVMTIEVFPDGQVWSYNIETVLDTSGNSVGYLGLKNNILYQYSYNFKEISGLSTSGSNDLIAIGYEESDTGTMILAGAHEEIEEVQEVWGGKMTFNQLSNQQFLEELSDYALIHLAVHSKLDTNDFRQSQVVLNVHSPGEVVRLHQINNIDMNADLIILSSCMSGGGTINGSEGILSLGRAFTIAGCKSVVASRSNVFDDSSAKIMKYFHTYLKSGKRKSEALRCARLDYLKYHGDNVTSDPAFWANYYVIGNDEPIRLSSDFKYFFYGLLLLIIPLIVVIRRKIKI